MDEADGGDPFSSVFTTLAWDGADKVAFFDLHLQRLSEHASRLRIDLPEDLKSSVLIAMKNIPSIENEKSIPAGLISVRLSKDGKITCKGRINRQRQPPLAAISQVAPRWSKRVTGCKHGDWNTYDDARKNARSAGADIALLTYDGAVIDGDRAAPILLDEDGEAWVAEQTSGGIDSITLNVITGNLDQHGIPVNRGIINERMLAKARELIVVGSGIGVARVEELDEQSIGIGKGAELSKAASQILAKALEQSWEGFR